ncbi:hypothetical protein BCV71DRAFT_188049, partial [Rhizopus microsporus]
YVDSVVIIAVQQKMIHLLKIYERYSLKAGYRWDPVTCIILDNHPQPAEYRLYHLALPRRPFFTYLGIPFKT